MPLIVLGVLVIGGSLALLEICRNTRKRHVSSTGKARGPAPVIYLPNDLEREKRRRNLI